MTKFSKQKKHNAISVESGYLDGSWQGHFPVTCVALMSLLDRALTGEEKFSTAERVLYVACEFWAACNAGELDCYFDLKADDPTRDVRVALRIIGALQMANLLDAGALGPKGGRANTRRRQRLLEVERRLVLLKEPMDVLIARFAWRYMSMQRHTTRAAFHSVADRPGATLMTRDESRG